MVELSSMGVESKCRRIPLPCQSATDSAARDLCNRPICVDEADAGFRFTTRSGDGSSVRRETDLPIAALRTCVPEFIACAVDPPDQIVFNVLLPRPVDRFCWHRGEVSIPEPP